MKRILNLIRLGLPETNSSSSHSVVISMNNNLIKPGDPDFDLNIRDNILYIPGDVNFGWEYFKYNTPLKKLQYLCGIFSSDSVDIENNKKLFKLKTVLKEIFNVKDVIFEWRQNYFDRLKSGECPEEIFYSAPEIDHNSSDIFEEIIENKETIKNFILSRDSWLLGGNDNSDLPPGFLKDTTIDLNQEDPEAILSVDFGGKIGRVDFEISIFPISYKKALNSMFLQYEFTHCIYDTISLFDFCWKISKNQFEVVDINVYHNPSDYYFLNQYITYYLNKDGNYYLIFIGEQFKKKFKEIDKANPKSPDSWIMDMTLKNCNDFVLVPVHIKLLKYNVEI